MSREAWARRVSALGQFRVADPASPELSTRDDHHLRRVLRARVGEEIVLTNGRGAWTLARVTEHGIERSYDVAFEEAPPETTLYLAPLKGDRSEWAIAKVCELGLSRVVPLVSARVVASFRGEAREKTLERWRRIAIESAGQCRRTHDLVIEQPVHVATVASSVAVCDLDGADDPVSYSALAIGPEGGWSPDEWPDNPRVGLGDNVLRSETAAVAAATLLVRGRTLGLTARARVMSNDEGTA